MSIQIPDPSQYVAARIFGQGGALQIVRYPDREPAAPDPPVELLPAFQAELAALKVENHSQCEVTIELSLEPDGTTTYPEGHDAGSLTTTQVVSPCDYLTPDGASSWTGAWLNVLTNGTVTIRVYENGQLADTKTLQVRASSNIVRIQDENTFAVAGPDGVYAYDDQVGFANQRPCSFVAQGLDARGERVGDPVSVAAFDSSTAKPGKTAEFSWLPVNEGTQDQVHQVRLEDDEGNVVWGPVRVFSMSNCTTEVWVDRPTEVLGTRPYLVAPDDNDQVWVYNDTLETICIWREGEGVWKPEQQTWGPVEGLAVAVPSKEKRPLGFSSDPNSPAFVDPSRQWAIHWSREGDPKVLVKRPSGLTTPSRDG